ncbi:hypothetical protein CSUI_004454 [Cystoisospora suis]|uniref:C2H2-type domain-containing protein n=1 Tax=Cystoisospora suis TaxID=483139 RepID=A0A2C6L127_9APIC|nr:hypothetical protein CSUI_004454 [Cystoisospora suis]
MPSGAPVLPAGTALRALPHNGFSTGPIYEAVSRSQTSGSLRGLTQNASDGYRPPDDSTSSLSPNPQQSGIGPNGTFVVGMLVRCEECGKKFINSFYLEKHKNKRHRQAKPADLVSVQADLAGRPGRAAVDTAAAPQVSLDYPSFAMETSPVLAAGATLRPMSLLQKPMSLSQDQPSVVQTLSRQASASRLPGTLAEQTEVILNKLDDSNERVKAEVQKEIHDVVKTFQTILKDEIKGLQSQLAGIEAIPPLTTQQVLLNELIQKPEDAKTDVSPKRAQTKREMSAGGQQHLAAVGIV